jgi:hypothetical protein
MTDLSALAQAESLLLAPFSLTEGDLARTFGQILTHQVDYADLYFQYSRSEAWSLDEGIVKSGSFNIDQGVGVRAISGEKTAFAYSDDISARALGDAAKRRARHRRRRAGWRFAGLAGVDRSPLAVRAARSDRLAAGGCQGQAARAPGRFRPRPRSRACNRSWRRWPANTR